MTQVKESKKYLIEIEELRQIINEKKKAKYEEGKGLGDLKDEAKTLQTKIKELKKNQEHA